MGTSRVNLEIRSRGAYADGTEFGAAGAYECIDGWLTFSVDPLHAANADIADLQLAPRDADGHVTFGADVCILQPLDAARSNRSLLLELPNRGRKLAPRLFNRAPAELPVTANIGAGDGFLLRRGWTMAWIGWQWDVLRNDALMGLEAPQAEVGGVPVRGTTMLRFQTTDPHRTHLLADRVHAPYTAADLEQPGAILRVRDYDRGTPSILPREAWQFAREDEAGNVVPSDSHLYLADGFVPGMYYELIYETALAPVVGCGLLAIRDGGAWLRAGAGESDSPTAGRIDHIYAWGMSQTGRMLRHFLSLALNVDTTGTQVFDGVMPHVGGARRGEFNQRFGQPSVQSTPGLGQLPPFDDEGLLAHQRAVGGVPHVIQTNTAAEYWRGDGALLHTSIDGSSDLPQQPRTRQYLFAGSQHGPSGFPTGRHNVGDGSRGRFDFNVVDYSPLMRAALLRMDEWVRGGAEPPASQHPRLADHTLVPRATVISDFHAFPPTSDLALDAERMVTQRRIDAGDESMRGILRYPVGEGAPFPDLVSAVDADGNEVAGIRLPDISVPIATHTGWNPRDPAYGGAEQIIPMQGFSIAFPRDAATRESTDDPRASVAERYASRADYLEAVRSAAAQLATERFIEDEDIETLVADADTRWDGFLNEDVPQEQLLPSYE